MKLGILLFLGVPASGKTSLAKTLKNNFGRYGENKYHFIHICYDELIPIQNENSEFEYKMARNAVAAKVENLVIALKNKNNELCPVEFRNQIVCIKSFEGNIVLIIDDNLYFKSMRYSFYQIARKHSIGFAQIFFSCSIEDALTRNSLRESSSIIPSNIIENMYSKIEPPNSNNMWEKYSLTINAFSNINEFCGELFFMLDESVINFFHEEENNIEQRELSLVQCKKSVLHQADIALRKIISSKVKEFNYKNSKGKLKEYCAQLNSRKPEILLDIKMGNICLSNEILDEINDQSIENYNLIKLLDSYF